MPSSPSLVPEEFQSGSAHLSAQLQRLNELADEFSRVSVVAAAGKASLEDQMLELLKQRADTIKKLEQQLEQVRSKANLEVSTVREELEAQISKCQAASASRENALKQAHQAELTELSERLQKQLGDRKRCHEEELHQQEMMHDAERTALSVKHATEMKKLASEMQTAVEEHNTQLTALRAALESREGAAAQRSVADRERLELQHKEEIALVRQDCESKLAELRGQISLANQSSTEFARKEAAFCKDRENWLKEKEALLSVHHQELGERDERVYQLEQALSRYESELSERNELQRSLATLMSRANNLLGPNSTPVPQPHQPARSGTPGRRPHCTASSGASSARSIAVCSTAGSSQGSSPVLDLFEVECANKENASPLAHV